MQRLRLKLILLITLFNPGLACAEEQWKEIRSPNFVVYTNGGDKRGREVALRFEQMRKLFGTLLVRDKLNLNIPLVIVAFKDNRGLKSVAPLWKGKPIDLAGLYLRGEDRSFIALDLSSEAGYPVVFHEYAHLMLNSNFPKTQLWFDEGFAEYYSTIEITEKEVKLGMPPKYAGQILSEGLMPVEKLFSISHDSSEYNENGAKRHMLYAQSWLAVHYIYDTKKLKEVGEYFDLVINQRVPFVEALKRAFNMTAKEFDKALSNYYRGNNVQYFVWRAPEIEPSLYVARKIKEHEALAQIADFHLHSRDHQEQAAQEFEQVLAADPNSSDAHRGLGYYHLRKGDFDNAGENFRRAAALGSNDARVYFYLAQFMFQNVAGSTRDMTDLQEMSALLDKAIALDPEYAEGYNLKAFVLSAANNHTGAIEPLKKAIQLSPREDRYRANLATQLTFAGKYDDAIAIWEYLKSSDNPQVAAAAARSFEMAKEYKEKPLLRLNSEVRETTAPQWRLKDGEEDPELKILESKQKGSGDQEELEEKSAPTEQAKADTRPIKFLKGTLNRVECADDGSAILTVTSGPRALRLYTKNAEKMLIIGDYKFACNWKNQKVAVNYKARDAKSGDIVSLEVQ
ncbi:MAG TPA: tetratricopeptide repeat protein [Terriglobales bacterium]|nr:tetratricopeptide repeat protein [Terriglobales bacterium]